MAKVYILEGPDGTGKTTLANALQEATKGHIMHLTFNKHWDMKAYYLAAYKAADNLSEYQDVIIDRWIPSEVVYGNVFRNGPSFDVSMFDDTFEDRGVFIYCWNENAVENHLKNKENRVEMFDDMTHIVSEFDKYIEASKLNWKKYNYNQIKLKQFVKEITK